MKDTKTKTNQPHIPVLLDEVLEYLDPKSGESYLDLTAGYGGHARAVLERTFKSNELPGQTGNKTTLVDRDQDAIDFLRREFEEAGIRVIHQDFLSATYELTSKDEQYDLILADLGVSSPHFDRPSRGFSLNTDGPLDMRMDQTQSLTAETIVNSYSEAELGNLIREYGQEPRAQKIARHLVENRPIETTRELAAIVAKSRRGKSKIHPATRTFQALRIAVNNELKQLKEALPMWIDMLNPGGRIAIISFHSLEDRIVKQALKEVSGDRYDAVLRLLTKQPVQARRQETVSNPRARSAKLRAAVKK